MIQLNEEQNAEYIKLRSPNKEQLAALLGKAKGPNRTMAQFAEECGVAASKFSRIMTGKITEPLSFELLVNIQTNSDPNSNINLSDLADANGMMTKEQYDRMQSRSPSAHMAVVRNLEKQMRAIITNELIDRGQMLRLVDGRIPYVDSDESFLYPRTLGDFTIEYNSENGRSVWGFETVTVMSSQMPDRYRARGFFLHQVKRCYSGYFLLDAWKPDVLKGIKLSFVFYDNDHFSAFSDVLRTVPIKAEFSAILVDLEKNSVVSEIWLGANRKDPLMSIFDKPKLIDSDSGNDDEFLEALRYEGNGGTDE